MTLVPDPRVDEAPHLLPSNFNAFERELARQTATLDLIDPAVISTIWDPWACPAALLDFLAWAMSVDIYDAGWSEITKRQSIADSPYYHRIKGTRRAVEMALERSGRPFSLIEWFEQVPHGRRGTARAFIETSMADIPAVLKQTAPFVFAAKPKSRPVTIGAGEATHGVVTLIAGLCDETLVTISPYAFAGENRAGGLAVGVGLLDETLTMVGPAS